MIFGGWEMSLGIVLEEFQGEGMLGDVRGQCPDTVPEWHKRNLVTLDTLDLLKTRQ